MTEKKSNLAKNNWKQNLLVASLIFNIILVAGGAYIFYNRNNLSIQNLSYLQTKLEIENIIKKDGIVDFPSQEKLDKGQLKGLVGSLEDPFSEYFIASEFDNFSDSLNQRYQGIGVRFEEKENQILVSRVFDNSPAKESGVQNGDVLLKVEDQEITGKNISEVISKIRGEEGTQVKLVFIRNKVELEKTITRKKIQSDLIYLDFKDKTAVIEITSFGENLDSKMQKITKEIKNKGGDINSIIVDLRGNTGGILDQSVEVMSYFMEANSTALIEKDKDSEVILRTKFKQDNLMGYKTMVLMDGNTASASEILAGSLRDNSGSKLVGTKSYGKGVVQRLYTLRNGDQLKLTIAEWLTPKATKINKVGLEPDFKVENGENILDRALLEIKK